MAESHPIPTHRRFKNLVGRRFDRLVVIGYAGKASHGHSKWFCRCDCGEVVTRSYEHLCYHPWVKSCGCWHTESVGTHRMSKTPTYRTWVEMIRRCTQPDRPGYENYGGRGIKVCERWLTFENFYADMGERPKGKTLDRYPDNNGNYEPGNCRWATAKEQSANTRTNRLITFNGETLPESAWCHRLGMQAGRITQRLEYGWPLDLALTAPSRSTTPQWGKFIEFRGDKLTVAGWARKLGLNRETIKNRLKRGWSIEKTLTVPLQPTGGDRHWHYSSPGVT